MRPHASDAGRETHSQLSAEAAGPSHGLLSLGRQRVANRASWDGGCVREEEEEEPGQGKEEEVMSQGAGILGGPAVIALLGGSHRVILGFGAGL